MLGMYEGYHGESWCGVKERQRANNRIDVITINCLKTNEWKRKIADICNLLIEGSQNRPCLKGGFMISY